MKGNEASVYAGHQAPGRAAGMPGLEGGFAKGHNGTCRGTDTHDRDCGDGLTDICLRQNLTNDTFLINKFKNLINK